MRKVDHYSYYDIQVIDFIRLVLCNDYYSAIEGEYIGNILKYLLRYKFKGGSSDLYKLKDYLDFLIEEQEDLESLDQVKNKKKTGKKTQEKSIEDLDSNGEVVGKYGFK